MENHKPDPAQQPPTETATQEWNNSAMKDMTLKRLVTERSNISDARTAVIDFLKIALPEAQRLNVTKLAQIDQEEGTWEAQVEAWQPNATIQALGLSTSKPVLDRQEYLARLDGQLNVIAYGEKDSLIENG